MNQALRTNSVLFMCCVCIALIVLCRIVNHLCSTVEGVSFTLRGVSYTPNDLVNMNDIGLGENGLIAITTYRSCCTGVGDWFLPGEMTPIVSFPGGTIVSGMSCVAFCTSRSENGELILNRGNFPATSEGLFRVSIPDAGGVLTDVYIGLYLETGGESV